jgi:hypothetical protein
MLERVTAAALAVVMIGGTVALYIGRASAQAGPLPVIATQQRTVTTAVVTAIDLNTRQVTLRGPNGSFTVHASDQVANLDQLKVGDKVAATYYESVVIAGKKASVGDNTVRAMSSTQLEDDQGGSWEAERRPRAGAGWRSKEAQRGSANLPTLWLDVKGPHRL